MHAPKCLPWTEQKGQSFPIKGSHFAAHNQKQFFQAMWMKQQDTHAREAKK
jgi:hypothetical protein